MSKLLKLFTKLKNEKKKNLKLRDKKQIFYKV